MTLTVAHQRILWHQFTGVKCPVCDRKKAPRNCFCRSCYFAVKNGDPQLAAGLWTSALEHRLEFFEKFAACTEWLREHGLGPNPAADPPVSGELFA